MRSAATDIKRAADVWAQCNVKVSDAGGKSIRGDVLDIQDPKGVLNEFSNSGPPTEEEKALLKIQPGGAAAVHAYFVPSMSAGSRGESFIPSEDHISAVVISDSAVSDSLAHELGHVVLDDGTHNADPDNLMATGSIRNVGVDKLNATQCGKV
jgi:hypothetical protein